MQEFKYKIEFALEEEYSIILKLIHKCFEKEEFIGFASKIKAELGADFKGDVDVDSSEYMEFVTTYVTPARQAYAARVVNVSPSALIIFIAVLMILLISMALFRSPAVALMPDVTPKPLRSKGNAIINLMGTVAGVLALVLGMIFATEVPGKTDFGPYMVSVAALMIVALIIFVFTVKENKWAKEMEIESEIFKVCQEHYRNVLQF